MRIFIALDIPGEIRSRMVEYTERAREFAPDAHWDKVEGLHLTLKFVGYVDDKKLAEISSVLATLRGRPFEFMFSHAGFFPSPKAPRVFWIGAESTSLTDLAAAIENTLERAGIPREIREYRPHVTLARSGPRPSSLKQLPTILSHAVLPNFGTVTASEFWLYQSQPGKGGSKYTKLQRFALDSTTIAQS